MSISNIGTPCIVYRNKYTCISAYNIGTPCIVYRNKYTCISAYNIGTLCINKYVLVDRIYGHPV